MRERKFGHPEFYRALELMADTHERKSHDYGSGADPLANCRASEAFGVPAWVGVLIRANDKVTRVKSFLERGALVKAAGDELLHTAGLTVIDLYDRLGVTVLFDGELREV